VASSESGEIGAGLDAVGHDAVLRAAERAYAVDADDVGTRAIDPRAHRREAARQVDHLGLARRVLEDRGAFGKRRSHHEILGAGDRDEVHDDARAAQALGGSVHVTVVDRDGRAHGLQALNVLIDGARADGAAAGQGHLGTPAAGEERAEDQHRGAHGFDQLVGGGRLGNLPRPQGEPVFGRTLDFHPHLAKKLRHRRDVHQPRHPGERERPGGQERGAHDRQRGVLRS
jgi:hypothetical protein